MKRQPKYYITRNGNHTGSYNDQGLIADEWATHDEAEAALVNVKYQDSRLAAAGYFAYNEDAYRIESW